MRWKDRVRLECEMRVRENNIEESESNFEKSERVILKRVRQ